MTFGAPTIAHTRARRLDPATSREAARNATSLKSDWVRLQIRKALLTRPMTAREIAEHTRIDYIEVQRRISEVGGIHRTDERRERCAVWEAV